MLLAILVPKRVWFSKLCARTGRDLECQMCARKGSMGMGFLVFVPVRVWSHGAILAGVHILWVGPPPPKHDPERLAGPVIIC